MKLVLKYTLTWLFAFYAGSLSSQAISLKVTSKENKEIPKLNYKTKFINKSAAINEISKIISTLHNKGFLLASADSIFSDSNSVTANISENKVFKTARLKQGNLDPSLASRLGISEKLYLNKPFKYNEVAKSFEKIIRYYENHGYPFASVKMDSILIEGENLSAIFNVQKNKFFKIDSIKIIGNAKVNPNFLYRYLNVKEGMVYNEEVLANISQKILQLPFLAQVKPQEARLSDKTNRLILFLDKKNASQFDGIIGLLPDADTKKTIVTGDIKLKLVNGIFRNGETFDLEWRRLKTQTQDFSGRIIYPYLFKTPVGTDYALKIYRRDTTFIDIHNNIGLQYYFSGLNNIKVYYKQRSSNLISTSGYELITALPDYADISSQSYGLGLQYEKLDYRFNPHKGFVIILNVQTGNRTINKNLKVNPVVYNNLLLRSTQYQFEGQLTKYFRIYKNNVLRLNLNGASVFGNSTIFYNELFRIGGLKTLRGFDEESIFTSTYIIPTIEYRFLFSQNSNLFIFTEGAWYENNANRKYIKDTPVSIGAGVNFETKAGILTLNYAIGNQFGNGFDPRSGKIHFGLIALF